MSTNTSRGETLDKRGLDARPRPAVMYDSGNVAAKDAKLKVPRSWRALRLSGTFHRNRSFLRDS